MLTTRVIASVVVLEDAMNLSDVTTGLTKSGLGIYESQASRNVSYPEHGHDDCLRLEDSSWWFHHRNNCISAAIRRFPFQGCLLDIGGGNGFVARRLVDDGHCVVLLEAGAQGARNARLTRELPHVICSTVEDAGFVGSPFGAVGLFDVIEHIEHDKRFITDVVRPLLRPAGKLYVTVPCHQWLWSAADESAGHFRRHTETSIRALLEPTFQVEFSSYLFAPLLLPQWLLRALPYRLGHKRNSLIESETEHGSGDGSLRKLAQGMLSPEARLIAAGRRIPVGASALIVASAR
jgi:SAM-dependent methyltransferase